MQLWWDREKLRKEIADAALKHYAENPGIRDVPLDRYVDQVFGKVEQACAPEPPPPASLRSGS